MLFSYGSGYSSEFYSGIVKSKSQEILKSYGLEKHLNDRYLMSIDEYETSIVTNKDICFGLRDLKIDFNLFPQAFKHVERKGKLVFSKIKEFHREYEWV